MICGHTFIAGGLLHTHATDCPQELDWELWSTTFDWCDNKSDSAQGTGILLLSSPHKPAQCVMEEKSWKSPSAHRHKRCCLPYPAMGRRNVEHQRGWRGSVCQWGPASMGVCLEVRCLPGERCCNARVKAACKYCFLSVFRRYKKVC